MRGKGTHEMVEATADHTFLRCKSKGLVKVKDIKRGDCLLTIQGKFKATGTL